ncbi:hypothetical protein AAHC03_013389 [Spirometra sp. Aus1]
MSRVLRSRILNLSLRPFTSKPSTALESASCPTHTGQVDPNLVSYSHLQVFDQRDFRVARFMESAKLVNKSFAADLINQIPPKKVTSHITYCDGGGGALGHPKVYINLDQPGTHTCGYCGLRFELSETN